MTKSIKEKKFSFIMRVKQLIEPVILRLETIDSKISGQGKALRPVYYRNEDLKKIFGLSNNTIIKYRQTGILPFTKLGDIFLYDAVQIEKILQENKS
ncbi:MAG: helix-turn-helix domain-containing protein [Flavobacterium circumlabens]|uniref:helix-turn-helix domain-containing protein n=1 Tax=Flavobacterium circumlabens TaxID=2133765 RepID=UPI003265337E